MRSDKPTYIFCEKKKIAKRGSKFPHLVTKICELCQRDPDWGLKMFATPIGDSTRFSGKNENQSISVINNFLSRSLKKN